MTIEDNGTGIKDISAAFSIGNRNGQESPLNEHGYGMKHALAAANKSNDSWKVVTKLSDNNYYTEIKAPFDMMEQVAFEKDEELLGKENTAKKSGTIISFSISKEWLRTITKGLQGNYSQLSSIMSVLSEDLGYTYGPILETGVSISIYFKDRNMEEFVKEDVVPVNPSIVRTFNPGKGQTDIDLSNGKIEMEYSFDIVKRSDYKKHYLANMNTSGVEIRLNGRLLADNLFSDIWRIDRHNAYNYLLVRIDLISNDLNKLPKTTTNKTSIKQDDPCLNELYGWIREKLPAPQKHPDLADDEVDLFQILKDQKLAAYKTIDETAVVKTEQYAFNSLDEKIRIDLYQSVNNKVVVYEGKKEITHPRDVYQLLMYWDGLECDGISVSEGILIASKHPDSVQKIVDFKNQQRDSEGKQCYHIKLKTWKDEQINYPN